MGDSLSYLDNLLLLVYTRQVNSTFPARWLANLEVICQVLFTSTSVNNCLLLLTLFEIFYQLRIGLYQEIIKVREWIPHIGPLAKVIRLKLV